MVKDLSSGPESDGQPLYLSPGSRANLLRARVLSHTTVLVFPAASLHYESYLPWKYVYANRPTFWFSRHHRRALQKECACDICRKVKVDDDNVPDCIWTRKIRAEPATIERVNAEGAKFAGIWIASRNGWWGTVIHRKTRLGTQAVSFCSRNQLVPDFPGKGAHAWWRYTNASAHFHRIREMWVLLGIWNRSLGCAEDLAQHSAYVLPKIFPKLTNRYSFHWRLRRREDLSRMLSYTPDLGAVTTQILIVNNVIQYGNLLLLSSSSTVHVQANHHQTGSEWPYACKSVAAKRCIKNWIPRGALLNGKGKGRNPKPAKNTGEYQELIQGMSSNLWEYWRQWTDDDPRHW